MILVVSLSPALDVTYFVSKIELGASHQVTKVRKVAGGKGVNVASVISQLSKKANLLLPLGGVTGEQIAEELRQRNIAFDSTKIAAETRTCVTVVSEQATVFNEPAATLSETELQDFKKILLENLEEIKVVVFSGSVPKTISPASYQSLIASCKAQGKTVIVDTSGEYLLAAISAGADWLKPNQEELLQATGTKNLSDAISELKRIGSVNLLLSQGSEGAMLFSEARLLRAEVPKVNGNPTGAGDAMVAGLATGLAEGLKEAELLARSCALGSAAVVEEIAGRVDLERMAEFQDKITVSEVEL